MAEETTVEEIEAAFEGVDLGTCSGYGHTTQEEA